MTRFSNIPGSSSTKTYCSSPPIDTRGLGHAEGQALAGGHPVAGACAANRGRRPSARPGGGRAQGRGQHSGRLHGHRDDDTAGRVGRLG